MRQLPALLLLITAALPIGAKWKVKEKRFDPVTVTNVQQIAGRYVGIDPDYVLDLKVSSKGVITGTMRNFGQASNLRSIRVDGAELTAMIDSRPLHATFVNRIRNGEPAFGVLVHDADVQIGDLGLNFFVDAVHREAARDPDGVLDRLGVRTAVTDDATALDA